MKSLFNIKYILSLVLPLGAILMMASCSDWTDKESVELKYPELDRNSAEYQAYLKSLKDYKKSDHQIVVGWFDNNVKSYASPGQHIKNAPDSVDIIVLVDANLSAIEKEEIALVQNDYGTKVLFELDVDAMMAEVTEDMAEYFFDEDGQPNSNTQEMYNEEYLSNLKKKIDAAIASYNSNSASLDGMVLTYTTYNSSNLTADELEYLEDTQDLVFGYTSSFSSSKTYIYQGAPQYVLDETLFDKFDYFLIQTDGLSSVFDAEYEVRKAYMLNSEVPTDKFLVSAATLTDEDDRRGYMADDAGTTLPATEALATWLTKIPADYTKAGLAIKHMNDDYYNSDLDYKYVRAAIGIINPSPKN